MICTLKKSSTELPQGRCHYPHRYDSAIHRQRLRVTFNPNYAWHPTRRPLAPLLFILLLDPLYRHIQNDSAFGLPIPAEPAPPPVAGYADVTAIYLQDETRVPHLLNPYQVVEPFMAITCKVDDLNTPVLNVYAPNTTSAILRDFIRHRNQPPWANPIRW